MDAIAEIRKIYYATTKATIQNDIDRAIELLKTLPTDTDREKVAVYMDGLMQMRSEWSASARPNARGGGGAISSSRPGASERPGGGPRGRSDPTPASARRPH